MTLILLSSLFTSSCLAPRKLIPPGEIPAPPPLSVADEQEGHKVFQALTEKYPVDYKNKREGEILDIVDRLTKAAGSKDQWHVYILDAPDVVNAGATKGNHIFIWSGLLAIAQNQNEVATVLAHEISHVLANHTQEDPHDKLMEAGVAILAAGAGIATNMALGARAGQSVGQLAHDITASVGQGFLTSPFNREKEFEADQIGLFLMAKAGYDPATAVEFWAKAQYDSRMPEGIPFLSDHPTAEKRLERLKELLPMAEQVYHGKPITVRSTSSTPKLSPNIPDNLALPIIAGTTRVSGDSFDFSKTPPSVTQSGEIEYFDVITKKALIYFSKNPKNPIGEVVSGGFVQGIVEGEWVRIEEPFHGFIPLRDLKHSDN